MSFLGHCRGFAQHRRAGAHSCNADLLGDVYARGPSLNAAISKITQNTKTKMKGYTTRRAEHDARK